MILNLSDVLSEQHKTIEEDVLIEMERFGSKLGCFPIIEKEPLSIKVEHVKERELLITGKGKIVLEIPCDRCLEPVATVFDLNISRITKGNVTDESEVESEDLDEANYIDGYTLDVDQLVGSEILIGWPTKILCSEDCKGICNVCGQNLNQGTCDCEDTSLDPRMSVIRDVFKNFKEV